MKHPERLAAIEALLAQPISDPTHAQALREAHQILTRLSTERAFEVTTIVSHETGEGKLDVVWCGQLTQMSPADARATAWVLVEAAAVAEAEAMLSRFLKESLGQSGEAAAVMVREFRRYREADPQSLVQQKGAPS